LGALEGSPNSRSMTYQYEQQMGWHRILVEGDPSYRDRMKTNSPSAFSANAAICENQTSIHFSTAEYVGGIVEFMSQSFMKEYHSAIYNAGVPPGNVSSLDWSQLKNIVLVDCIPLSAVIHRSRVKHINFFILDVEGGEFEVLKSINWAEVRFDVICVETEPANRPPGFPERITQYLEERGYRNASGQQGRNICELST
jgi:FkbM family methyltransferase